MAEKDVGLFKIGVETDTSSFENISRTLDKFIKKTAIEKKIRLEVDKSALNDVNKYLRVIENSFTGLDSDVLSDWFGKQMEEISKSDSIDIAVSKYERLIRVLEKFGHINVDIEGFDQVKDLTTFEKYLKSFIGNYESYQKKLDKITKEINKTQSGINIARKMESYWNAGEDGTKKSKTDLNNLIEYISLYESYIKKLNDIEATGGTLTELQNIYKTGLTDNINKLFSESEVIDAFGDLPKILQQSINKTLNNGSIINPFESILDNFKSGIKKSVDSIYGEQLLSVPIDAQFEMKKESYDNIVDRAATAIKQAFKGDSIELEEDVPIQLSLKPKIDEEFQDAIQERIDALKITGEVFVKPKLASTFESDLQNALDARVDGTEAKAKIGVETIGNDDNKNKESVKLDGELSPTLSDTFKDDAQAKVNKLGEIEVKLTPELKEGFRDDLQSKVNSIDLVEVPVTPNLIEGAHDAIYNSLNDEGAYLVDTAIYITNTDNLKNEIRDTVEDGDALSVMVKGVPSDTFFDDLQKKVNKQNKSIDVDVNIKNSPNDDEFDNSKPLTTGTVELYPVLNNEFKAIVQSELDAQDYQIELGPKLTEKFKENANILIGREGVWGDAYVYPLIDAEIFSRDLRTAIIENGVHGEVPISPVTSETFDADMQAIADLVWGIWNSFQNIQMPDLSKALRIPKNISSESYTEIKKAILEIKDAVKDFDFDTFERFLIDIENLSNLKISKTLSTNLTALGTAIKSVYDNLKDISTFNEGSSSFISNLEILLNRSDELKNLSSILKTTKLSDINKAAQSNAKSNSKSANDEVIKQYEELIQLKRDLLKAEKAYNRAVAGEDKMKYANEIDRIKGDISSTRTKLDDALDVDGVNGNFSRFEHTLEGLDGALAEFRERLESIRKTNEEVSAALAKDSAEWGTALSLLTNSDKFNDAVHEGKIYYDLLEDIVSIERTLRTDNLTGESYLSYKFTDSNGTSITTGLNGDLEIERKKILDVTAANKQLANARKEAAQAAKNGEDNEYVNSLNEQLAVFDQKYAKGFKPQTKEEVEEYQKLANALAEVVTKVREKRKADQDAVSAEKQAANDLIAEKYKELNAANDALIQSQEELLDRLKNNKGGFAEVAAEIDENRSKVTALNNEIKDLKSTYGVKTSGGISSDATQRVKDLDKEIEAFRNVEKITEELSVDSDEFGNVLRQALNQSTEEADTLLQKLGEIKSVIKTTKTDNITGISSSTYKVTGTTGTATFGSNGITSQTNLLSQETHAESVVAQYKEIQKAVKLVADEEAKAANNRKTFSAAQQAQLMQIKNLEEQIKALDGVNGETFELDTSITSSINQYKKFAEEITNAANAYKKFANGASQTSVNKFLSKMYTWMNQNSKGAKIFKNELTAIIETTKALGPTADLKALEEQFLEIANAIEAAGLQGQSFGDRIKGQVLNSAAGIVTTYLSIQDVIRYVKEAVDTIEDLDYALLDLKKTTDLTDSQLEDFYYTSSDMASQLGITTEEVISLASSWSRLGYGASGVVEDMTKLSAEFAAISPGMTVDEAQEGMVSVMKAYGIEDATEIRREIMDNINALGKVLPKHMVTYGVLKCA